MNLKNGWLHFILVVTIGCTIANSAAQMPGDGRNLLGKRNARSDRFTCLFFSLPMTDSDSAYVRVYMNIPYSNIQFVRRDSLYSAKMDLMVHIQNPKGEPLFGKIVKKNLSVDAFRKTRDPGLTVSEMFETKLAPGVYTAFIELDDAEITRPMLKTESITIPEYFSKPIVLTEPLFFHGDLRDSSSVGIFPDIPPVRTVTDTLYFAKVWIASKSTVPRDSGRAIRLSWSIIQEQEAGSKTALLTRDSTVVVLKNRVQPFALALNQKYNSGRYRLQITAADDRTKADSRGTFVVRWGQHALNHPDSGMRINTLEVIMSSNEVDELKALTPEEQKIAVEQFWKKRDPTQGTPENELEEEYYRRVEYVNAHFSTRADDNNGWKTDRGRIYLVYGAPTETMRNQAYGGGTKAKEVEIWYYQNIQKRFVFEDVKGTDEYRLTAQE